MNGCLGHIKVGIWDVFHVKGGMSDGALLVDGTEVEAGRLWGGSKGGQHQSRGEICGNPVAESLPDQGGKTSNGPKMKGLWSIFCSFTSTNNVNL